MKRRREMEDGLAMLNGRDASAGEAPTVPRPVHEEHDRRLEIAGAQEVAVYRVGLTRLIHGAPCGHERLREHLPAEHAAGAEVAIVPAVDVDLELLELEQR